MFSWHRMFHVLIDSSLGKRLQYRSSEEEENETTHSDSDSAVYLNIKWDIVGWRIIKILQCLYTTRRAERLKTRASRSSNLISFDSIWLSSVPMCMLSQLPITLLTCFFIIKKKVLLQAGDDRNQAGGSRRVWSEGTYLICCCSL